MAKHLGDGAGLPRHHDTGGARPKLRKPQGPLPLKEKAFEWPALPGKPRSVFKPLGKRVKTAVREQY